MSHMLQFAVCLSTFRTEVVIQPPIMPLSSIFAPSPTSFKNKEKFIIYKIAQILSLSMIMFLVFYYRNKILYKNDILGQVADLYKLTITIVVCFIVIIEPMINFKFYKEMNQMKNMFYKRIDKNFINLTNASKIKKMILNELTKISIFFWILFVLSELGFFYISMRTFQSRNIYFVFLSTTILLYVKVGYIVYDLISFKVFLSETRSIAVFLKDEFDCSEKLKSYVYDKMLEEKFLMLIEIYQGIQGMINVFNSSAIAQLTIFLGIKFYLMGDFYWIALISMHEQIKLIATYGERMEFSI